MRYLLCVGGLIFWGALSAAPLFAAKPEKSEEALWGKKRVVVVLGEAGSKKFQDQAEILKKGRAALKERDVAVLQEGKVGGPLHQKFGQGPGFLVMIFGKDETEKLRAVGPITLSTITVMVDAMPMRKEEVKAKAAEGRASSPKP